MFVSPPPAWALEAHHSDKTGRSLEAAAGILVLDSCWVRCSRRRRPLDWLSWTFFPKIRKTYSSAEKGGFRFQ